MRASQIEKSDKKMWSRDLKHKSAHGEIFYVKIHGVYSIKIFDILKSPLVPV